YREALHCSGLGDCAMAGRPIRADLASAHAFGWRLLALGIAILIVGFALGSWLIGRAIRLFRDVDAVLDWHPSDVNSVHLGSSLANNGGLFRFYGVASHAAAAPERGRSALDGAMIMLHAIEMLREHVPQETRIHYIITNGGNAPNIVPAFAEVS